MDKKKAHCTLLSPMGKSQENVSDMRNLNQPLDIDNHRDTPIDMATLREV